jgi:hypothetical protein
MSIADLMPTHIVNYILANGVVFDNEGLCSTKTVEMAARVSDRALILLDTLVWERGSCPALRDKPAS